MKFEKIDDKARVWILMRGDDGKLQEQLDTQYLTTLGAGYTAEEIADVLVVSAGQMELAENRIW